jgi:hypothetical protein
MNSLARTVCWSRGIAFGTEGFFYRPGVPRINKLRRGSAWVLGSHLPHEKPFLTLLPLASTPHSVWVSATPTPLFRDQLPAEPHSPRAADRPLGREKKSI